MFSITSRVGNADVEAVGPHGSTPAPAIVLSHGVRGSGHKQSNPPRFSWGYLPRGALASMTFAVGPCILFDLHAFALAVPRHRTLTSRIRYYFARNSNFNEASLRSRPCLEVWLHRTACSGPQKPAISPFMLHSSARNAVTALQIARPVPRTKLPEPYFVSLAMADSFFFRIAGAMWHTVKRSPPHQTTTRRGFRIPHICRWFALRNL